MSQQEELKIGLLTPVLYGGGAENHFRRIAPRILKGADRHVFVHGAGDEPFERLPCIGLGKRAPWDYIKPVVTLARTLRRERYDLIVAFSRDANLMAWLAVTLARSRVKLVTRDNTQIFRRLSKAKGVKPLIWTALMRMVFRSSDLVLTNSESAKEDVIRECRIHVSKVCVVGNPIDLEEVRQLSNEGPGIPLPCPYIVCVARLREVKRVDVLIDAFAVVKDEIPHTLVLIGNGPLENQLKRRAEMAGLSERVVFLGWVDNPFPLMKQASAVILPSWVEGLPNAVLEAFALARPVVATYCTSWIRYFESKEACLAVEPNDVEALAKAILRLLNDPTLQDLLSQKSRSVADEFSAATIARAYDQVLLSALR